MRRACLACLLCAGMLAVSTDAWAKWTRLSSEHFVFVGDASERSMRNIAQRLEQFRDVAGRVLSDGIVMSPVPTVVVVFENAKSLEAFTPLFQGRPVRVAGYFVGMEDANVMAVNAEQDTDAYGVIFHEYAHFLSGNAYGPTPPWVSEGLAELYETFQVDGERSAMIGRPSGPNLALLQGVSTLIPVADLIAVGHDSPMYNEGNRRGVFYAESWALVHYLSFGSKERQGQLRAYLIAIRDGIPPAEAFAHAFGADTTALDRELRRYIQAFAFNALRFQFDEKLVAITATPTQALPDADVSGYLGDLLARLNRTDDARAYLKKAIDANAGAARAIGALGLLELRAGNEAVALPLLDKAASLAPDEGTLLAAYGRVLARLADRGRGDADELYEKAHGVLTRALQRQPENAPAMVSLAEVEMGRGVDTARAVTLMQAAIKAAPGREEYRLMLAQALAVNGDYQGASTILGMLVARGSRQDVRDAARQALGRVATARNQASRLRATVSADNVPETTASSRTADGSATDARASAGAGASTGADGRPSPATSPRPTMPQGVYLPALRSLGAGETRVQGTFTAIECRQGSIVLQIDTPSGPVRMAARAFPEVEFITYRDLAPTNVACGAQRPALPVLATFRAEDAPIAGANTPNTAVALELVPDGFVLK